MKKSSSGKYAFTWITIVTAVVIILLTAMLCMVAVSSLWHDVNRFISNAIGFRLNWVAIILGAAAVISTFYGVQLVSALRLIKKGKEFIPGMARIIAAAAVFLMWGALILALFIEAGDAVLLAQFGYYGSLLVPWLLMIIGVAFGYAAYAAHRRGIRSGSIITVRVIISMVLIVGAVAVYGSAHKGQGGDDRAPADSQVFNEQVLYDAVADAKYVTFRIPGIVVTSKGVVVTYCEAREGYSDWAKIDVYMKRSLDGGEKWEERRLLYSGESDTVNNPIMIAENNSEIIHFLYNTNYRRAFYRKSTDAGKTWSKTMEITNVFGKFNKTYPWKVIAFGPGHGIQMNNGRLIAPVWLSPGGGRDGHHPQHVATLYSDDGGKIWRAGEMVSGIKDPGMGEPVAVELSDGSVMLNMRNEIFDLDRVYRAYAISPNGISGWSAPQQDRGLPDAVCFGSLHRYDGNTILFSNIHYDLKTGIRLTFFKVWGAREPLGIRVSFDDGKTWPVARIYQSHEAGYSDIYVHKGTVYALYEQGWEKRNKYRTKYLKMARFNMAWIKGKHP